MRVPPPLFGLPLLVALAGCSSQDVLNTLTPSTGYRVADGIVYDAPRRLRLDVYTPQTARAAPVIVFFYGGRWSRGTREEYRYVGQALAAKGFVAVLPDVRLAPAARFPEFVQDAARAVRWAHDTAARHGGDPKKLFVMGHSTGAHLAALLALDETWLEEAGGRRDWLRGMIGLAGPYDFMPITAPDLREIFGPPERFELSQPVNFVDGENPPLLLLHGENDETVDVASTRRLAATVAQRGGTVETVIYRDLSHAWILSTLAAPLRGQSDVLDQIDDFVLRRTQAGAKGAIESRRLQ